MFMGYYKEVICSFSCRIKVQNDELNSGSQGTNVPISENRAEFAAVYNRYKTDIHRFCCKMLNDSDEAKDVVQEVFLKFFESTVELDGDARVRVWLFKSARNKCLNRIRDRAKISNIGDGGDDLPEMSSSDPELSDSSRLIEAFFEDLPLDYREVLIMREWNELSYAEIAEALDTTVSAVKSKLFKARRKASEVYEKLYGDL